ncbi:peptidase [Vibrio sp. S4M6]|uniref:imelysin family protein n=1 Tax=Vibrio sinus TaxID=2946865 RepID=UPI002029F154|nr:imelysin family protein [Vibrio sinus]MCL9780237.1 peptidase [Vibrio sinus]
MVLGMSFTATFSSTASAEVTKQQVVEHYADLAHAVYSDALITAKRLQGSIDTFLASPSKSGLEKVKNEWRASRVPYQQSEVFRFGNPVVDEWEGQLNAWPLDEGLIDYVSSDYQYELGNEGATANIVANEKIKVGNNSIDASELNAELLVKLNELGGSEANVASGYHAIEFLLWGQDLNGTQSGAGNRPYTDFIVGKGCTNGHCDRRSQYLKAAADLLVNDLTWMEGQWSANSKNNYRQTLLNESAEKGLRRILFGMGSLSLGELAGERMKVALEANSTEDEHDCFSDNTHYSHYYNEKGIYNVYTGTYLRVDGSTLRGASIASLVAQTNQQAERQIKTDFDNALSEVHKLVDSAEKDNQHFDQLIAANNKRGHKIVNGAIVALVNQTASIERAASIIGITDLNPDTADHDF